MYEEQEIDMWKQMEHYAIQNSEGVFGMAIADINKKKHEMRVKHFDLYLNNEELNKVNELSQEQPLEISDLAVDHTQPTIEQPQPQPELGYTLNHDTTNELEQPVEQKFPQVEQQLPTSAENRLEEPSTKEVSQRVNYEPQFSADQFKHELEGISQAIQKDSVSEQSIAAYEVEKAQKHDMKVMEGEFATTFDEHRHALPLKNDGSLRDFFYNTRNSDSIQIFSYTQQNMTTGELIESYKNSDDPIAENKLNQAMDVGYREMLKTHKEERQALSSNPDSTQEDWDRFEKQVSLETGMYDYHLKSYEYDKHQDYVQKLENAPQNRETQLELYNAKQATPEVPSMENLHAQYQEYKEMTPQLENHRQEISQSIKIEEQSIGQSQSVNHEVSNKPDVAPKQDVPENIRKMREQNPEFAKKVEANLQNSDYKDRVNNIRNRLEPELNIARNKALKIS